MRKLVDDEGSRISNYMGGDGTFAEVAKEIEEHTTHHTCAMGMLPTGTGANRSASNSSRSF